MARRRPSFDPEDFDLNAEMEAGAVIALVRGRYSVFIEQVHVETVGTMEAALKLVAEEAERTNYYPNTFYVNDHGNVDLLALKPKTVRGKVIKVDYEIVHGWV